MIISINYGETSKKVNAKSLEIVTFNMVEELLEHVIDYGLKLGANYVEARYQRDVSDSVALQNGVPLGCGYSSSFGVSVRVLYRGGLGFAATNKLTKESIESIVNEALQRAEAMSRLRERPATFSETKVATVSYEVKAKESPLDVPIDVKLGELYEVDKTVMSLGVKIPSRSFRISTILTEKVFVNSEGAYVRSKIPRINFFYMAVIYRAGKGTMTRWSSLGASTGWEELRVWNARDLISEEVKTLDSVLEKGKAPPKEEVDVILGPEVVGIVVHESCGHPSELDRILGREGAEAGESYMKVNMLGERIGTEHVTIIDDPTIPKSYGFYLYDDEGVRARPKYLFKDGVINEFLMNREYASILRTESNGSARASRFDREPIIRMSNTYLAPGDWEFEEMLSEVRRGVYIKTFSEWNICDRRWNQRYGGLEAYYVENGEVKYPVRNPFIELTTNGIYSRVVAVGKRVEYVAGMCGKGNPGQGVPVWFGGPHVLLKGVKLSVTPKGG